MLLKPIITEKSMALAQTGQFTFSVTRAMTKSQIKTTIESLFSVNVVSVRSLKQAAKMRRSGKTRQTRQVSPRFKAIVALKPGQTIEYFELPEKNKKRKKPASTAKRGE